MTFGKWPEEIHDSPDQQKRLQSAKGPAVTPISVNSETQTGVFGGSGNKPYQVGLNECTCGDFVRRKRPCKHIYRLAMELGLLASTFTVSANPRMNISLAEAVGEIENYSDETQQFLINLFGMVSVKDSPNLVWIEVDTDHKYITSSSIYAKDFKPINADCVFTSPFFELVRVLPAEIVPSLRKRDMEAILDRLDIHPEHKMLKAELVRWCLSNVPDLETYLPERYFVSYSPCFKKAIHKCIKYLRRKFEWDSFYIEDSDGMKKVIYPHGAKFQDVEIHFGFSDAGKPGAYTTGNADICYFPEDEITQLLTQYGHNRCQNGFKAVAE